MAQDHYDQSIGLEIEGQDNVSHPQQNVPELHPAETTFFAEYLTEHRPTNPEGRLQEKFGKHPI